MAEMNEMVTEVVENSVEAVAPGRSVSTAKKVGIAGGLTAIGGLAIYGGIKLAKKIGAWAKARKAKKNTIVIDGVYDEEEFQENYNK